MDWEACLHLHQPFFLSEYASAHGARGSGPLGEPVVGEMATSFSAEPLGATSPGVKPTKEGGAPGDEPTRGEALKLLYARGAVQPVGGTCICFVCSSLIRFEAPYKCAKCSHIVHVRCLKQAHSTEEDTARTDPASTSSSTATSQTLFEDCCLKCGRT